MLYYVHLFIPSSINSYKKITQFPVNMHITIRLAYLEKDYY